MNAITRNVGDLGPADREALEHLLGCPLHCDQSILIQVVQRPEEVTEVKETDSLPDLPEWLNIYEGLSEQEIDELHEAINQRSRQTRNYDVT